MEIKFTRFKSIDSTNDYAKRLIESSENLNVLNGTVISANSQTKGKGKLGRQFYSPEGTGIYLSLIYIPQVEILNPALITCSAAIAVKNVLDDFFNVNLQVKWVNDLYLNNKKVCGILTEGVISPLTSKIESIVIGIGININTQTFPQDLLQKAGSISSIKIDNQQKEKIEQKIAENLFKILNLSKEDLDKKFLEIMNVYRQNMFLINRTVEITPDISDLSKNYKAKILDVTSSAQLKIQTLDNQILFLNSGEISIKKI